MNIQMNKYQTPITQELLDTLPEEVQNGLLDVINNVEFIRRLISPNRQRACDRPRDDQGRIIVELSNHHILEEMYSFMSSYIHFRKYGCYTFVRLNSYPTSEYAQWIR